MPVPDRSETSESHFVEVPVEGSEDERGPRSAAEREDRLGIAGICGRKRRCTNNRHQGESAVSSACEMVKNP